MAKILNKADIFAKKGLDPRTVEVEEWGGDVMYRPMSMIERREVRKKCMTTIIDDNGQSQATVDSEKLEVLTLIYCVLDPADPAKKKLLFGFEDMNVLEEQMPAGGISTVAQAILRDSGLAGNAVFRGKKPTEE